jgi:tRNA U34 5-carboxymethylaminomethyl modifying GTPase MnmE/TrmE
MKYLALYLILFLTSALALTPKEKELVSQMRDSLTSLRTKLNDAQTSNNEALKALSLSSVHIAQLLEQSKQAAEEAAKLTEERDSLAEEIRVAQVRYEKLNNRYQTAQLIIALLAAFFIGLLTLQFTHNLQPPYGLLVPILAGAAAFFTIYIVL